MGMASVHRMRLNPNSVQDLKYLSAQDISLGTVPHFAARSDPAFWLPFITMQSFEPLPLILSWLTPELWAGPLVLWRPEGILVAFPVVAYGFTAHQFLFNIYATLRVPSVKRMTGVVQNVCNLYLFPCSWVSDDVIFYLIEVLNSSGNVGRMVYTRAQIIQ